MNSKFYKSEADRLLSVNDRKSEFVKITLVLLLVNVAVTALIPPLASLVVIPLVSLIMARTAYKIYCDKDIAINDITSDFSKTVDVILYNLITLALTILGTFLFIIPGIIIGLQLSLGYYIMVDEPEISFSDAIKKSREMMKGHLWEYFKLQFSFFGWYILIALTAGILSLWVTPRIQTATMVFYARLKKERYGADIPAATQESAPFESYSQPSYSYVPTEPAAPVQPEAAPVIEAAPAVEETPVVEETAPAEEAASDEFAPPEYVAPAEEPAKASSDINDSNINDFKL